MAYNANISDAYGGGMEVAVAQAKATDTVLSAGPARLCRVLITATGTAPTQFFDNATVGSGNVIGIIPTATAVGTELVFDMPCNLGLTVKVLATNHGFTVSFN
jgi:hypothetical protein